jgi:hypothetical protein
VRVVAELSHRLRLPIRPGLDSGARAGRVVERNGDLVAGGVVVGEVDALAPALAEEAAHAVAAGDLGRDVGRKRLGARLGRGLLDTELGAAEIAESRALTILVATGRTPHGRSSKSGSGGRPYGE